MKKLFCLLASICICFFAISAFAADAVADPAVPDGVATVLTPIIQALGTKFGWLVAVIAWVGTLRLLVKPVFEILHTIAAKTQTTKDDEFIANLEQSKAFKTVLFILDWLTSVKLVNTGTGTTVLLNK